MPAGLNEEIIVIGDKAYSGYFIDLEYVAKEIDSCELVFFVSSHTKVWRSITVPKEVKNFDDFEAYLKRIADEYKLDARAGFMFRLQAEVEGLRWFIVGGIGNQAPNALSSFLRNRTMGGLDD